MLVRRPNPPTRHQQQRLALKHKQWNAGRGKQAGSGKDESDKRARTPNRVCELRSAASKAKDNRGVSPFLVCQMWCCCEVGIRSARSAHQAENQMVGVRWVAACALRAQRTTRAQSLCWLPIPDRAKQRTLTRSPLRLIRPLHRTRRQQPLLKPRMKTHRTRQGARAPRNCAGKLNSSNKKRSAHARIVGVDGIGTSLRC